MIYTGIQGCVHVEQLYIGDELCSYQQIPAAPDRLMSFSTFVTMCFAYMYLRT